MKVTHDKKLDVLYIKLTNEQVDSTKQVAEDVVLDFDADGNIVGIELLSVAHVPDISQFEYQDITHERYRKPVEK